MSKRAYISSYLAGYVNASICGQRFMASTVADYGTTEDNGVYIPVSVGSSVDHSVADRLIMA